MEILLRPSAAAARWRTSAVNRRLIWAPARKTRGRGGLTPPRPPPSSSAAPKATDTVAASEHCRLGSQPQRGGRSRSLTEPSGAAARWPTSVVSCGPRQASGRRDVVG